MNNEELIMNNEKSNVGAGLVSAQETKNKNHTTYVGTRWYATQGITLIALIITIIVMLILAGVVLNLTIGERGIFKTAQQAKIQTEYTSAKEIIALKLMEIHTDCISEEKEYTLKEIAKGMENAEDITVEKYYYSDTSSITGIVVSANEYSKYKFLIGEKCEIKGVLVEKITEGTEITDFKPIDEFETDMFGGEVIIPGGTVDTPDDTTVDVPSVGENTDISSPIEITTYISIKSNTKNTLNLAGVEGASYLIQNKTDNITLENNILIANSNADSTDSCKIQITGRYNGQNYKNNLTVYVEPKNRTTVKDGNGNTKEAFAICTEQDLVRMQEIVTTGANNTCNAKLMNNIELNINQYEFNENGKITFKETAKEYNSIGSIDNPYSGIVDGNGHEISGLYIKDVNEKTLGLFGMISENGEVKNINIKNSYFDGARIGGIAGYNEGKIYGCKVQKTTIESTGYVWSGGIVGINNGEIIECATILSYLYGNAIGGITGVNGSNDGRDGFIHNSTTGKIYRCYSTGYIGGNECSGIADSNGVYGGEGYVNNCYSSAEIGYNYWNGSIAAVQSYQGRGGYIYNSYYLNSDCNFPSVATPQYYGNVTNSYSNDTSVTAEKLNSESNENVWTNDIKDEEGNWKYNNGYPILKWQLE